MLLDLSPARHGAGRARLPDARYQRWIDTCAAVEFADTVAEVLAIADRTGAELGAEVDRREARHFAATDRYEWMFWDPASREEGWPVHDVGRPQ